MPFYHYSCEDCGECVELRKLSERNLPATCPSCGQIASRIIKAPLLSTMEKTQRMAHYTNERSANEPQVVRRKVQEDESPSRNNHKHNHFHSGSSRPWMIGH